VGNPGAPRTCTLSSRLCWTGCGGQRPAGASKTASTWPSGWGAGEVIAGYLRRSEARQAAEHLARAEAWLGQEAPELRAEIATIRARLLCEMDTLPDDPGLPVRR
jgi:hypothetical protein